MSKTKMICRHCVREPYLRQYLDDCGTEDSCTYCGRRARAFRLSTLADRVEAAFEKHYERSPQEPTTYEMALAAASGTPWSRSGVPVVDAIETAAEIPRAAALDIQVILGSRHYDKHAERVGEETDFCSEAHYDEREVDGEHYREQWFEFERTITSQARFFGHHAKELLSVVFANIDDVGEIVVGGGRPPILEIGPAARLNAVYRARVFRSEDDLENALCRPDRHLGPPPGHLAPAGRMNARGISVFYGATDDETAIAEVRPPVGSLLAVARFEIIRPLRILSLEHLGFANAVGSLFDEAYAELRQRAAFLQSLSELLCQPVAFADDDLDHLPTQVVADFLATENDPRLDGIAYPSTQIEGGTASNVVLFHHAARVEQMDLPEGAVIQAMTAFDEEGFETGFEVFEFAALPPEVGALSRERHALPKSSDERDPRQPSLRIDLQSVLVHNVAGVQTSTYTSTVSRRRVPSTPPPVPGASSGSHGRD